MTGQSSPLKRLPDVGGHFSSLRSLQEMRASELRGCLGWALILTRGNPRPTAGRWMEQSRAAQIEIGQAGYSLGLNR